MTKQINPRQMQEKRLEDSPGSSVPMKKFTMQTAAVSALLLVLVASIIAVDAFVPNGNSRQHSSGYCHQFRPAFVSTSKIRDLSARILTYQTRLFSEDDDDDMMEVGGDFDDYIDEDYDDNEFVIDVQGDGEYDDDEDDLEDDPYLGLASSEFGEESSSALATTNEPLATDLDWGGALGSLRARMEDVESGASSDPSQALFRMMSAPTPNQIIGKFVSSADPQVVQAMSGAITSLLGGLSSPNMGVEVQVKASGEKIGSLCFQLQMTGYMFRNAEYVLALKDLMQLRGKKLKLKDYKDAFDRVDTDNSGYIEISEIQNLFKEAYGREDDIPAYEIRAFLEFFDTNEDGKVSWEEFEQGLASAVTREEGKNLSAKDELADRLLASMESAGDPLEDDDDDDSLSNVDESISGTIEIEMESGKIVKVDAEEYMESLKEEARKLKLALRKEKANEQSPAGNNENDPMAGFLPNNNAGADDVLDIAGYIASRQGDVKSLTEGIKPEIVETMKKLVEFVIDGGDSRNQNLSPEEKASREMEIPGSALQQLALWQLVLGYRLREEEAKGEYVKLLK